MCRGVETGEESQPSIRHAFVIHRRRIGAMCTRLTKGSLKAARLVIAERPAKPSNSGVVQRSLERRHIRRAVRNQLPYGAESCESRTGSSKIARPPGRSTLKILSKWHPGPDGGDRDTEDEDVDRRVGDRQPVR